MGPTAAAPPWEHLWRLDEATRQLFAPNGAGTALTGSEFAFLACLFNQAKATCSRADLIRTLDRPSLQHNDRNLDGIVRRLRRKIEKASKAAAPIHVI